MVNRAVLIVIIILNCWNSFSQNKKPEAYDIDGNAYPTKVFGKYVWFTENLKTTHYSDGKAITYIYKDSVWAKLYNDAYCMYNNDSVNKEIYGALYNWYAVNTGKLCPDGWHVPSDDEWKYLEGFIDSKYSINDTVWDHIGTRGYDIGQRMMTTSGWFPVSKGSDAVGFSAVPGGERLSRGKFFIKKSNAFWWTSSEYDQTNAWFRSMMYDNETVYRATHDKRFGFAVRCTKKN